MGIAELTERVRGFLAATHKAILFEEDGEVRGKCRVGLGREAVRLLFDEIFPPEARIIVTALSHNQRAIVFWSKVGFDQYRVSFERLPRQA